MKRHYRPFIILLFFLLLFSSCEEENEVVVKHISGISVTGFREGVLVLRVTLLISNDMNRMVVVRGLKASVFYGETEAGRIKLSEKIKIPAHSEKKYKIPVEITLHDLGDLGATLLQSAVSGEKKELHLKGVMKIRSGILCKRIPFDEQRMIRTF
jgi:LEA14-like dessication related protein